MFVQGEHLFVSAKAKGGGSSGDSTLPSKTPPPDRTLILSPHPLYTFQSVPYLILSDIPVLASANRQRLDYTIVVNNNIIRRAERLTELARHYKLDVMIISFRFKQAARFTKRCLATEKATTLVVHSAIAHLDLVTGDFLLHGGFRSIAKKNLGDLGLLYATGIHALSTDDEQLVAPLNEDASFVGEWVFVYPEQDLGHGVLPKDATINLAISGSPCLDVHR
ncbi:unnamed protein product [Clonostachys solani]|uniref:Uncharacterized protein n=1 Tax=Clonostachys solani TaxID=160281 RepID=A0A9N9W1B6_9HYPO|nr:unnamed protein product [Clonostachys solani]